MSNQKKFPANLEDFQKDKEKYNILYPSEQILEISPLQKVTPEVVKIESDPKNGEVVKVGASKDENGNWVDEYALTTIALEKIAHAAGITFDPTTTRRTDDGENPRRVEFQATGALQKPDGTWITVTQTKELDLDVIERETRLNFEEEARNSKLVVEEGNKTVVFKYGTPECMNEINRRVQAKMILMAKNKIALAETGAQNRVIRALLTLKPFYRRDELDKPFVVFHLSPNSDFILADSELKREFFRGSLAITPAMFASRPINEILIHDLPSMFVVGFNLSPGHDEKQNLSLDDETSNEDDRERDAKEDNPEQSQLDESTYKLGWSSRSRKERLAEVNRLITMKRYGAKPGSKRP